MRVWRPCKQKYAETAFDGEGARRVGGRWNTRGAAVAYASEHLSLAVLEVLVHVDIERAPSDLVRIPAEIPDSMSVDAFNEHELPDDWRRSPGHPELKRMGDDWLTSTQSAVLRVPSVVVPAEDNVLVNPNHPDFEHIDIGEPRGFSFDDRLMS